MREIGLVRMVFDDGDIMVLWAFRLNLGEYVEHLCGGKRGAECPQTVPVDLGMVCVVYSSE